MTWFPLACLAAWALILRTVCAAAAAALFLRLLNLCTGDTR